MDSVDVPKYFICPISLQIMKDPVTAATGITYDRESIERWLFSGGGNTTCPVTNQPISGDDELTPNHTLRRLIQAWCSVNSANGVERYPTPRAPANRASVLKLLRDLSSPNLQLETLKVLSVLAADSESNRRCMLQSGAAAWMISTITSCVNKSQPERVEQALAVLHSLRPPPEDLKPLVSDNHDLFESLTWFLQHTPSSRNSSAKSIAVLFLKSVFELAGEKLFERLKVDFFREMVSILGSRISTQVTKAVLELLLSSSPFGRNRTKIVEAGAMRELIELELTAPDKRTTELVLGVVDHLCGCADGRAELVGHAAGIALVSKRILRVSPAADERAVRILSLVGKYSATGEVVQEMLRVGAVSKLCFLLQADCSGFVKERATWILKMHSGIWRNSPCVSAYLLSRYP